jgi:protein-S-isoprenylcysteine O-methyltransferase Ste14
MGRIRGGRSSLLLGLAALVLPMAGSVVVIAIADPVAWPGAYAMVLEACLVVALLIGRNGIPILWGPFRFAPAKASVGRGWQVARQIVAMWGTFLVQLPLAIAAAESALGWGRVPHLGVVQVAAGLTVATGLGAWGIAAAREMIRTGDGTPLPAACTKQLVISGPYARLRNPMALTGIGQGMGVGVALGSPGVIVYALCGAMLWDLCVRPVEEAWLANEFGDAFESYRCAIRCWLPAWTPYRPTR